MNPGKFGDYRVSTPVSLVTFVTIDGVIVFGNKGNTGSRAALSANGIVIDPLSGLSFVLISAILAACRFVRKAFFCVELLLTGGEYEFLTAIPAGECFVLVHLWIPFLNNFFLE